MNKCHPCRTWWPIQPDTDATYWVALDGGKIIPVCSSHKYFFETSMKRVFSSLEEAYCYEVLES